MKRERARKKIEDAQRAAILQDKVALFQGDIAKINPPKSAENGNGTGGDKPKDNKPLTDSNTGTLRRLSKIADNTGKLVDETKKRSRLAPPNFKPSLQSGGFLSLPFAAFVIQSTSWQCRVVNASLTAKQQQAGPCLLRDAK